jgi:hypothetical protein
MKQAGGGAVGMRGACGHSLSVGRTEGEHTAPAFHTAHRRTHTRIGQAVLATLILFKYFIDPLQLAVNLRLRRFPLWQGGDMVNRRRWNGGIYEVLQPADLHMRCRAVQRALLMATLFATAATAAAYTSSMPPLMTGERLVKLMGHVDPATVTWASDSPFRSRAIAADYQALANGQFVHGYIQAVHDATKARQWCRMNGAKPMPHELESDARRALQQMPDTQLKRNAADLIVEIWRAKWPCPAGQRKAQ